MVLNSAGDGTGPGGGKGEDKDMMALLRKRMEDLREQEEQASRLCLALLTPKNA